MSDSWIGVFGTVIGAVIGAVIGYILQEINSKKIKEENEKSAKVVAKAFLKNEINGNHIYLTELDENKKSKLSYIIASNSNFLLNGKDIKIIEWDKYKLVIFERNPQIAESLTRLYDKYIELERFEGKASILTDCMKDYDEVYNKVKTEILD